MMGTSQLKPISSRSPVKKLQIITPSHLSHSASMMNLKFDINSSSSTSQTMGINGDVDNMSNMFLEPTINHEFARTKTSSTMSLKNAALNEKRGNPVKIHQEDPRITPIRFKVERTPGGTINKATIIPKMQSTLTFEKMKNENEITPPTLRRSSSGSMLLRQTPERVRRQEGETSPVKKMRRSGSMPKSVCREDQTVQESINEIKTTPVLKRKRTSSLTALLSLDMPTLTPQRFRPRGVSESRYQEEKQTPSVSKTSLVNSPIKKRNRTESGSFPSSPLKKRYVSCAALKPTENVLFVPTPVITTPMRKIKSTIFNPKAITERITQQYGAANTWINPLGTSKTSVVDNIPPKLVTRSTSGDTYYSVTDGEESVSSETPLEQLPAAIPSNSLLHNNESMVPLVKKQMSIDEKILEDEEDEGFGDSTKTIKRGQGSHLARSVSLKLSPRVDLPKPLGTTTEKSCSTPSLPTAPLIRQSSTLSLRFKVSPSTFLNPADVAPLVIPAPPPVTQSVHTELSEPSTSKVVDVPEKNPTMQQKSALRKTPGIFNIRDDSLSDNRRRKIKFSGLNVHYFDRRQGESTVPTEGDVSLDMHNTHHTHRYFSLSTGKRPQLNLSLYEDDELSEDEVIYPDSDEDRDYDEYTSAKTIPRINQRHRIKLLKKSGVKVEKNPFAIDSLRNMRSVCGCSCENGVCLPATCECALVGINCQVDGGEYPTIPCNCFAETCTNPEGRIFYDPEAVHQFRHRTIMNWRASQKSGISGSPVVKKFVDSDDEEEVNKQKNWLLKKAIPIKLEESPTKYPVTPVYTRRSRSSLSDIRESTSEGSTSVTPSTSLSERIKELHHLDNEVCVEEEKESEIDKDETIVETDITFREVFVRHEDVEVDNDAELLESALSPVKTTLVV